MNLKYLKSKKYRIKDIVYLIVKKLDLKKKNEIVKKYNNKKIIIINSNCTKIKINRKIMLNFSAKFKTIENKVIKKISLKHNNSIKVIKINNISLAKLKKILLKQGIFFNNNKISNPTEIKAEYIKKLIFSGKGNFYCLFKKDKMIAYLFFTLEKKIIHFYDINIVEHNKNGFLIMYLFKHLFKQIKKRKIIKITTNIDKKNIKSRNFFCSLGLKEKKRFFLQYIIKT